VPEPQLTFPLRPKRRLAGLAYGTIHSTRRGTGSDVAGSRPYRRGDHVKSIDWAASARLSRARGRDEFVVREHFADEAPRIVVVCDRAASMSLYPSPWLDKPAAVRSILRLVSDSALAAQGYVGYLDHELWRPPATQRTLRDVGPDGFGAPPDAVSLGLEALVGHRRDAPAGTFAFVVSDYLRPPPRELWLRGISRRLDLIPVVVQDPVWEQGFPEVDGIVVPLAGSNGRTRLVRLATGESRAWRERHERRLAELAEGLRSLGIEPVVVGADEREHIFGAFLTWSAERQAAWGHAA
jgi:uncharacterized protein (DUF58 family)